MKTNILKRTLAGVLAVLCVAGTLPANVDGGGLFDTAIVAKADLAPVTYLDADGTAKTCSEYNVVNSTNGLKSGWNVVSGTVELGNQSISGDVNIILCDNAQLTVNCDYTSSLSVTGSLAIYAQSTGNSMGALVVSSSFSNAISVNDSLTINGGNVSATTSGSASSGIRTQSGNITINGGNIDAVGTNVGINAVYGDLEINGGTVTAQATHWRAVYGNPIKNKIPGIGWADAAGTGDGEVIEVNTTGQNIKSYKKVEFRAPKPLAEGTEIYVKDNVLFGEYQSYYNAYTSDGVAYNGDANDVNSYWEDTVLKLTEITYDSTNIWSVGTGVYSFKFGDEYIRVKSPQFAAGKEPIGLKVVSGNGTTAPFVFKMLFAPLEVTTTQPQVIKAGDKFKVEGEVNKIKLNNDTLSNNYSIPANTVFTASLAVNGNLQISGGTLPTFNLGGWSGDSAKTYLVEYNDGTLTLTENKIYKDDAATSNTLHIGDVLAPGAKIVNGNDHRYFQKPGGTYILGANASYVIGEQGLMQSGDSSPEVSFAEKKNAFVFDHITDGYGYFNQTHIDLGATVETAPQPVTGLTYDGYEKALVTEGTPSEGAKMQYAVVPQGKIPATKIVSGDYKLETPQVGAVYKPTGGIGFFFVGYHIQYGGKEYYGTEGTGNIYKNSYNIRISGEGDGSANSVNLPDDCDAIYVESISGNVMTVKAVNSDDYVQAAYGDTATATDAGKYDVYYKAVQDGKDDSEIGSVTATIAKANLEEGTDYTAPEDKKSVYTGDDVDLVKAGTVKDSVGKMMYGTESGVMPTITDASISTWDFNTEYMTIGMVYRNHNCSLAFTKDYRVVINGTTLTGLTVQDPDTQNSWDIGTVKLKNDTANGTYILYGNAEKYMPLNTKTDSFRVTDIDNTNKIIYLEEFDSIAPIIDWSEDIPKGTDVGKYTVYYKVVGDKNHNDTAPESVDATIIYANPKVIAAPTSKNPTRYMNSVELINAGTAQDGTMMYSLGTASAPNGNWTADASSLTANAAGTYYVWYQVEGYNGSTVGRDKIAVSVTQGKLAQAFGLEMESYVYDGTAHEAKVRGAYHDSVSIAYYNTDTGAKVYGAPSEVGNYKAVAHSDGNAYYSSRTVEVEYSITAPADSIIVRARNAYFTGLMDLVVKFKLPESVTADSKAYVEYSWTEGTEKRTEKKLVSELTTGKVGEDKVYVVENPVYAPEMENKVTYKFFDGNGKQLNMTNTDMTEMYKDGYQFSLRDYLDLAMANGNDDMKALADAAYDYGIASQINFKYGDYQNLKVSDKVKAVKLSDLEQYKLTESGTLPEIIKNVKYSVEFAMDNTLRVKFNFKSAPTEEQLKSLTCTIDGKAAELVKLGDTQYALVVSNIAAPQIDTAHTFTISDGTNTYTTVRSALSYAYSAIEANSNPTLVDLAKAMYLYNQAANEKFAE